MNLLSNLRSGPYRYDPPADRATRAPFSTHPSRPMIESSELDTAVGDTAMIG